MFDNGSNAGLFSVLKLGYTVAVVSYNAYKEGKFLRDSVEVSFDINFTFKESFGIFDTNIRVSLHLYNTRQFEAILRHYYHESNKIDVTKVDYFRYRDFLKCAESSQEEINTFNRRISAISKRIHELSKYLTFDIKSPYSIRYVNLDTLTLPLAMEHLRSVFFVLNYLKYLNGRDPSINESLTGIFDRYKDVVPYRSFQTYHTNSLLYAKTELPLRMVRIRLEIGLVKEIINTLKIRNIDQFKAVLRSYQGKYFTSIEPSSGYEDLDPDIAYRSNLQLCMNKVSRLLNKEFTLQVLEEGYDPLTLDLYCHGYSIYLIKYLEFIILTFKTGNDDQNDRDVLNMYLSSIKDRFLSSVKEFLSSESLGEYYMANEGEYKEYKILFDIPQPIIQSEDKKDLTSDIFQLNLHIILKQYQRIITKTLHLEESMNFIRLFNLYNYLLNGYLPSSNTFDKSLYNLLYILDQDENDPSILNLYYYPLSNELDTSLIIKHLENMLSFFKYEENNPNDIRILEDYLSSITPELDSLSYNRTLNYPSFLSLSIPGTDTSLNSLLLSSEDDRPWDELDNRLDVMIVGTNLRNAHLDDTYPRKVSEQPSPKIGDPRVYWKAGWAKILYGSGMDERSAEVKDNEDDDDDDILSEDPLEDTSFIGRLEPSNASIGRSDSRDVSAMDGRLGGASTNIPNLLEVTGNDISMMEDID